MRDILLEYPCHIGHLLLNLQVGTLEEMVDDNHAIVSSQHGPESYVAVYSFVDQEKLEPGCSVLMHHKSNAGECKCPILKTLL
jgi:ATP-dependent 26S proteasome regulatory subunit